MIGRLWHGWTSRENAEAYETLLRSEVLPGPTPRALLSRFDERSAHDRVILDPRAGSPGENR